MTAEAPTEGALKAAKKIEAKYRHFSEFSIVGAAEIIDCETRMTAEAPTKEETMQSYRPDPNAYYLCCYCNKQARLRDADVVVDSYKNVCHYECLMKADGNSKLIHKQAKGAL